MTNIHLQFHEAQQNPNRANSRHIIIKLLKDSLERTKAEATHPIQGSSIRVTASVSSENTGGQKAEGGHA